jgi:beta-glucosidase
LVGFATSDYQNCGREIYKEFDAASNWSVHECMLAQKKDHPLRTHGLSGHGTQLWNNLSEHIELIKELEGNAFRFSVEWAIIEPRPGYISEKALNHYEERINALLDAGITPMITLHHFTHPLWFEQMGGWTEEKNIAYFVRFCKLIFSRFKDKVELWIPINEIAPFAFQGYCTGVFPPAVSNPWLAAKVVRNMLQAHCQVYDALKMLDFENKCKIGFNHNYLHFETADTSSLACLNLIEKVPTSFLNYVFNDAILHFLKTGILFPYNPFLRLTNKSAPLCFDFIGLNFYSRVLIKSDLYNAIRNLNPAQVAFPTGTPGEIMTDMPFPVSPESFYDGILAMGLLGVPLYITENGCPDTTDTYRPDYIRGYLAQVSRAMKHGIDIKGYFHWTLVDNFEWDHGYTQQFGLCTYDENTGTYVIKKSGFIFRDIISQAKRV